MRIGIIIPDRGDRPEMLKNCMRLMANQTILPVEIALVNEVPENNLCDITKRYRIGYDQLRNKNIDVIAFIENDDWYAPNYLETMYRMWEQNNRPDLLGLNHTIYYHAKLRAHFTMYHDSRSSAMNTLIRPDLDFKWCNDSEAYTDTHLWMCSGLKGVILKPEIEICLGIKHGIGLCGGRTHIDRLHRFKNADPDLSFLKAITIKDPDGFKFLSRIFDDEKKQD